MKMNNSAFLTTFHITFILLLSFWFGVEGRALNVKQTEGAVTLEENVNSGRANDGTPDTDVDDIVTLLAGFKQPSALSTCGMRPTYQLKETWTKKSFVRVVAGMESTNRWPWQVALVDKTTKEPFCGGTLIASEHIVTAAHCFDNRNRNDVIVVLGEQDWSVDEGTEQKFPIDCVHVHRNYVRGVPYINDIAVVKLKTSPGNDVVINDFVMPACMPEKNEFKAGDECYVTGWGYTNFFDLLARKRPNKLNEARLPLLSNYECKQAYGTYISKKMVCAGYLEGEQRADTCKGDSGGPLICQRDGVWKLFGVTSWGTILSVIPPPPMPYRVYIQE